MGNTAQCTVKPLSKLEFYRRKLGVSSESIDSAAGLPRGTVSHIERGARALQAGEAERIAAVLGISPVRLLDEMEDFDGAAPCGDRGNIRCLVRKRRKARGWDQAKLSARTGMGVKRISVIESGRQPATLEEALCLAEMLDCSVEDLFRRKQRGLMGAVCGADPSDLTGRRFGKLSVLRRDVNPLLYRKGTYWICRCDCGKVCKVRSDHLKSGHTKSCGCLSGIKSK